MSVTKLQRAQRNIRKLRIAQDPRLRWVDKFRRRTKRKYGTAANIRTLERELRKLESP